MVSQEQFICLVQFFNSFYDDPLKGSLTRDFTLQIFLRFLLPPGYPIRAISNLYEKFVEIFATFHHGVDTPASLSLLPEIIIASIVDTSVKPCSWIPWRWGLIYRRLQQHQR